MTVAVEPTRTLLKLSDVGATVRMDGFDSPMREMNSSDVAALEAISMAETRVVTPGEVEAWGVKVTARVQFAPGSRVEQLLATVKSGVV